MKLTIINLDSQTQILGSMAGFGKPIEGLMLSFLKEEGFTGARVQSAGCLGWIWCQWLSGKSDPDIHKLVEAFVERGIKMQDATPLFYMRPNHDLLLLHCAIFASRETQLKKLAKRVVDASGYEKYKPLNDGELYASAWCGLFKYWILGDLKKAEEQSNIIWDSYHPPDFKASTKPLVKAWLKGDWDAFAKAQLKTFDRLWNRSRKDGAVVSEKNQATVVDIRKVSSIQQLWCWADCGMAMLAHRRGAPVATDPFWFPPQALEMVPKP
jgi:hypothetical protein